MKRPTRCLQGLLGKNDFTLDAYLRMNLLLLLPKDKQRDDFFVLVLDVCVRRMFSKVNVVVRDVKLARGLGWLSKGVQKATKDSGRKQAERTLKQMVDAASKSVP